MKIPDIKTSRIRKMLIASAWILMMTTGTHGDTRTWDNGGVGSAASTVTNWSGDMAPVTGDDIVLDGANSSDITWDLDIDAASWTQMPGYSNTVTFLTKYPEAAFTNFNITGNVVISNGIWTHPANSAGASAVDCLRISIGGNLLVASNAQINVNAKGYAPLQGPGAAPFGQMQRGTSHGGMGGRGPYYYIAAPTYGSFTEPLTLGSSGNKRGGGSARITVTGATTLEGSITANGEPDGSKYAGGSGGSIFLTTGSLEGGGDITASGRGSLETYDNSGGGGGGRIAVVLTGSNSFGNVAISAPGGKDGSTTAGAAGTVYLQTQTQATGEGTLIVDQGPYSIDYVVSTRMPEPSAYNPAPDLTQLSDVILTNGAVLWINTNTVFDFGVDNLRTYGPTKSTVVVGGTNGLSFPAAFTVSTNYQLLINTTVSATGNWIVPSNAVISHTHNYTEEAFKFGLILVGDLTVDAGGAISVDGKGYKPAYGPGAGGGYNGYGASYGGMGGQSYSDVPALNAYGSVRTPTNIGSGATSYGNGAVQLDISGMVTINGTISARKADNPSLLGGYAGNSGGSIWIVTEQMAGSGLIDASGQPTSFRTSTGYGSAGGGGGGRVSVILTASDSLGNVRINTAGGKNSSSSWEEDSGAAGTLYIQTASQGVGYGTLLINNNGVNPSTNSMTQLPVPGMGGEELMYVTLVVTNGADVALTTNAFMQDLYLRSDDTLLYLNGYTLNLNTSYHSDWGTTNRVVYAGGKIVWNKLGAVIIIL